MRALLRAVEVAAAADLAAVARPRSSPDSARAPSAGRGEGRVPGATSSSISPGDDAAGAAADEVVRDVAPLATSERAELLLLMASALEVKRGEEKRRGRREERRGEERRSESGCCCLWRRRSR